MNISIEEKREICKAFAYGLPVEEIAAVSGLSKEELRSFADENKETIAEIMAHYKGMEG